MKKEVLTFIFDGYADWESAYICSELNKEDTEYVIKTISVDNKQKISMAGFRVTPDYSVNDYPSNFEALLLLGGDAWFEHKNDMIKPVVKYAVEKNILVAAICGATIFMGQEGYLDHIKHTSNTLEFLKDQAPSYKGDSNYIEKQAVCDGNIITANGTASLEFAREIMKKLNVKSEEMINKWYKFNKEGFYKE